LKTRALLGAYDYERVEAVIQAGKLPPPRAIAKSHVRLPLKTSWSAIEVLFQKVVTHHTISTWIICIVGCDVFPGKKYSFPSMLVL
jgi:hypothetical protein